MHDGQVHYLFHDFFDAVGVFVELALRVEAVEVDCVEGAFLVVFDEEVVFGVLSWYHKSIICLSPFFLPLVSYGSQPQIVIDKSIKDLTPSQSPSILTQQ